MKIYGYHEGDRSEYLAQFAFSTVGHCIPVPREADYFLTDLIVHLFSRDGKVLKVNGLEFGIQIKSDTKEVPITGADARCSFFRTLRPLLIGVIGKREGDLSVYTTIHRLRLAWTDLERDVKLTFSGGTDFNAPCQAGDTRFLLGEPIIKVRLDDLDHPDSTRRSEICGLLWALLTSWVEFEVVAITGRRNFLPGVHLPLGYQTNQVFDARNLQFLPVHGRASLPSAMESGAFALKAFNEYMRLNTPGDRLSDSETAILADFQATIGDTAYHLARFPKPQ